MEIVTGSTSFLDVVPDWIRFFEIWATTMFNKTKLSFAERVQKGLEILLEHGGVVSPIDLLLQMHMLHDSHLKNWKCGHQLYPDLESHIQCGEDKFARLVEIYYDFVRSHKLVPFEVVFEIRGPHGTQSLKILKEPDEQRDAFFRAAHRRSDLPEAKQKRIEEKRNKPSELAVFEVVTDGGGCTECGVELKISARMILEQQKPLCLECADIDHLELLPAGNATLTRRAKKFSPLSAVLLRFNRRRNRYDRLGILVTVKAIADAEESCEGDADFREQQRARAAAYRDSLDQVLVAEYVDAIRTMFPKCPVLEAQAISEHTAARGSGRVGRSAAGRAVDANAVRLSVIAWVRHQHTPYDELLMKGVERMQARAQIADTLTKVFEEWAVKMDN